MMPLGEYIRDQFLLLTFRMPREKLQNLTDGHLFWGALITWVVGIGRWWDFDRASTIQRLGLFSIIYIVAFAGIFCLWLYPFQRPEFKFKALLRFTSMVSLPGILYAVPVERIIDASTASAYNLYALLVVAAWRLSLLIFYMVRASELHWLKGVAAALLPLDIVVVGVSVSGYQTHLIDFMGGVRQPVTSKTGTTQFLFALMMFGVVLFLPLLAIYAISAVTETVQRRRKSELLATREKPD